ncbi:hypothetical protein LCGC14_2930010, partial [marine sediment metagenome]
LVVGATENRVVVARSPDVARCGSWIGYSAPQRVLWRDRDPQTGKSHHA